MKADELMEIVKPMLVDAYCDGKKGVMSGFYGTDEAISECVEAYRGERGHVPTARSMQVMRRVDKLLARAYAAGVAAREAAQ